MRNAVLKEDVYGVTLLCRGVAIDLERFETFYDLKYSCGKWHPIVWNG